MGEEKSAMDQVLELYLEKMRITESIIEMAAKRIEGKLPELVAGLKKHGLDEVILKTPHWVLGWFTGLISGEVVFTNNGEIVIRQPAYEFEFQGEKTSYPEKRSKPVRTRFFVKRWLQQPNILSQESDMPFNPNDPIIQQWVEFYGIANLEKLIQEKIQALS